MPHREKEHAHNISDQIWLTTTPILPLAAHHAPLAPMIRCLWVGCHWCCLTAFLYTCRLSVQLSGMLIWTSRDCQTMRMCTCTCRPSASFPAAEQLGVFVGSAQAAKRTAGETAN